MKIPIIVTLLIATVAAAIGWSNHLHLAKTREDHARMTSTAAARGISLDPKHGIRITKHVRENPAVETEQVIADFFALVQEWRDMGAASAQDEVMLKRWNELMKQVLLMDVLQLKSFLLEGEANQEIGEATWSNILDSVLLPLSANQPAKFLTLLADSPELIGNTPSNEFRVGDSLRRLAKDDLAGATEWIRIHGKRNPRLVADNAKGSVIFAVAGKDPKLAFQLIGDLEFKNPDHAINNITSAAKNSEQRTATLAALREYLVSLKDAEAREKEAAAKPLII